MKKLIEAGEWVIVRRPLLQTTREMRVIYTLVNILVNSNSYFDLPEKGLIRSLLCYRQPFLVLSPREHLVETPYNSAKYTRPR